MAKNSRSGLLAFCFVLGMAFDSHGQSIRPATTSISVVHQGAPKILRGRVILFGKPPAEKAIPLDPTCGSLLKEPLKTKFYSVGRENGLADVVVKVQGLPARQWAAPIEPRVIATRNCVFEPYVSAMQLGERLQVLNEGSVMHNVHLMPARSPEANFALMPNSKPRDIQFIEAEDFIRLKSDVQPWMFAYVTVVEHPFFAVTDADGKFEIKGLPEGAYQLMAMHRKAGTLVNAFEMRASGAEVDFRFEAKEVP